MTLDWKKFPNPATVGGMERYVYHGIIPGSFLQCVIRNELVGFFKYADSDNVLLAREYADWMYNEMPTEAWGSQALMLKWIDSGGLQGREDDYINKHETTLTQQ